MHALDHEVDAVPAIVLATAHHLCSESRIAYANRQQSWAKRTGMFGGLREIDDERRQLLVDELALAVDHILDDLLRHTSKQTSKQASFNVGVLTCSSTREPEGRKAAVRLRLLGGAPRLASCCTAASSQCTLRHHAFRDCS